MNPMSHMLQGQQPPPPQQQLLQQHSMSWSEQLTQTWSDTKRWNPQQLSPANIMDYFCERTNPFYEMNCNNEQIRMQRISFEHLVNMQGVEYVLLRWQEPILFVIRKQYRHSPSQVTPQALYYIINGVVHAAPDLGSLFNSRLLTSTYHLQSAFNALNAAVRYHPTDGYSWAAPAAAAAAAAASSAASDSATAAAAKPKAEASAKAVKKEASLYQRQRVDALLKEWAAIFPSPQYAMHHHQQQQQHQHQMQQQQQQQQQPHHHMTGAGGGVKKTGSG